MFFFSILSFFNEKDFVEIYRKRLNDPVQI